MPNRLSDPSWKSGPKEPKYSHSDHAIEPDGVSGGFDLDGFGREEVELVEGEPLVTVMEAWYCSREGCDEYLQRRHLYTLQNVEDRTMQILRHAVPYEISEYIWDKAIIVDYDETPILGVYLGDDDVDNVAGRPGHMNWNNPNCIGYIYPERTVTDEPTTTCHGRTEPPSHEPYGL